MTDHSPVTGPFRITVESIPAGVMLDVEPFVRALLVDVVDILSGEQIDTINEIADADPADPHGEERLAAEHLVEMLTERLSTRMPVYGSQVLALAERLRVLGLPKAVPAQREASEGGAAA